MEVRQRQGVPRRGDREGDHGAAHELTIARLFSIPNESNTNAVAERHIGVIEDAVRRSLAHVGAPACVCDRGQRTSTC